MKKILLSVILLFSCKIVFLQNNSSKKEIPFSFKEFKNLVNFFESKQEMMDFFEFKKGDSIADIGAGYGAYEGAFSLLYDSLTFYVQDIDTGLLSQKKLDKTIKHYSKLKGLPQSNKFFRCIGTEKASNLPDNTFDKIVMISAFHEFTFMDEMIADLGKKLKVNGKVYIVETHCSAPGHKYYTPDETAERMRKHGFTLLKKQGKDRNGGEGIYEMVFTK